MALKRAKSGLKWCASAYEEKNNYWGILSSNKKNQVTNMSSPPKSLTSFQTFSSAGLGGVLGWIVVHPCNTAAVKMSLASMSGVAEKQSFLTFSSNLIKNEGFMSLYAGLSAGVTRQIFYASSRFGLFEKFRDAYKAKVGSIDFMGRMVCGVTSGAIAAGISCPAEVTLVRLSNDGSLPEAERRNYKGVGDAFARIFKEEGPSAFFRGAGLSTEPCS